jgi:hypothetical protein
LPSGDRSGSLSCSRVLVRYLFWLPSVAFILKISTKPGVLTPCEKAIYLIVGRPSRICCESLGASESLQARSIDPYLVDATLTTYGVGALFASLPDQETVLGRHPTEHEKGIPERSFRCRMGLSQTPSAPPKRYRASQDAQHPRDPKRRLLHRSRRLLPHEFPTARRPSTTTSACGAWIGSGRRCTPPCASEFASRGTPCPAQASSTVSRPRLPAWVESNVVKTGPRRSKAESGICW